MVSSTKPSSLDPLIQPPEQTAPSGMDLPAHVRMYNRFISTAKWFVIHTAVLLVALYFAVIDGNASIALFLALTSVALMIYGFLRRRPIREDIEEALHHPPGSKPSPP